MVEVKMILSALNFMGFSLYGYLLFINLDNLKGTILMVIGGLFGLAKLVFYIIRQRQAVRKEEHEQKVRELEYNDKLLDQRERDIVSMNNELDANIKQLYKNQKD